MSVPLCSSDQICAALRRLGFLPRAAQGSHQVWTRTNEDGHSDVCTVVIGKSEVPRGTLRAMLRQAKLTEAEFVSVLK